VIDAHADDVVAAAQDYHKKCRISNCQICAAVKAYLEA
jgi:hypothetical protein